MRKFILIAAIAVASATAAQAGEGRSLSLAGVDEKVPAALGIRSKNAGDQRIAIVKPGSIAMGLTDIRPRPTADNAESYFSFWSIRCFSHNITI